MEFVHYSDFRVAVKFKEGQSLADSMSVADDQPEGEDEVLDIEIAEEASTTEEEPEPSEPTVEELLEAAQKRADLAEKEIGYRDAEIQNVRKRMAAERAEAVQYASIGLARRMLSVLNDVDRALSALPEGEKGTMAEGLQLMRNRLWQELSAAGVSEIATDVEFDPNLHEAITTIPASEEAPAKSIVSVLEAGYRYKERIIKAARVVVAAAPPASAAPSPKTSQETADTADLDNSFHQAEDGDSEE